MTIRGIIKTPKPYVPKNLVHGYCVPTNGAGEHLICSWCASIQPLSQPAIPVTFDGLVKCHRCLGILP